MERGKGYILRNIIPEFYDKRRIQAIQLIKQGKSKQEVYEILRNESTDRKGLSSIVRYIPSVPAKRKYLIWNYFLILTLFSLLVFYAITSINLMFILIYVLQIIIAINLLLKYYIYIAGMSVLIVFLIIIITFQEEVIINHVIFQVSFQIPTVLIPLFLVKRMSPLPKIIKEDYYNKEGFKVSTSKYEFSE